MEDFIHFVIKYWYLALPFALSLGLLLAEEARVKGMFHQVDSQQVTRLINREQALVVDIRDSGAFKESHIIDAINIPQNEFKKQQAKLDKHKEKPIILVCDNGQKSGTLSMELRKQGFEKATALSGGLRTWQADHMPMTQQKPVKGDSHGRTKRKTSH